MTTLDEILFLLVAGFLMSSMFFLRAKSKDHKNLKDTVESDKRLQAQYELRKEHQRSNALVILLTGVLIAIGILYFLSQ